MSARPAMKPDQESPGASSCQRKVSFDDPCSHVRDTEPTTSHCDQPFAIHALSRSIAPQDGGNNLVHPMSWQLRYSDQASPRARNPLDSVPEFLPLPDTLDESQSSTIAANDNIISPKRPSTKPETESLRAPAPFDTLICETQACLPLTWNGYYHTKADKVQEDAMDKQIAYGELSNELSGAWDEKMDTLNRLELRGVSDCGSNVGMG
ncbi:hypothetical protein F66182_2832 [Fusarium sp. NRRL 66182]|nr:hypothetical protein F66182_2832 [Fusarium sp. NRRL 66182]